MPCFHPLQGWRSNAVNPATGKRSIVFNIKQAYSDMPVTFPCGQCIGCRLEKSRQWAIRCVHEASLYERNCFITLTYNNENLPPDHSLVKKHFQDFMKRLRKAYGPNIRYFHCGEYGERLSRPHYHACLFNFDFPDKKIFRKAESGDLYTSEIANEIWKFGFCVLGSVSFDSAAYVARYITKKITGEKSAAHYGGRLPEYTTMSRRPGIAKAWFDRWQSDVYPSDSVIMNGKEIKPPKYYDRQFEIDSPTEYAILKNIRKSKAPDPLDPEFSSARLAVKEKVQILNLKSIKRSYENET